MTLAEEMHEQNKRRIDERLDAGIALLREHYTITECAIDPAFERPNVGGRPNHVRRFLTRCSLGQHAISCELREAFEIAGKPLFAKAGASSNV